MKLESLVRRIHPVATHGSLDVEVSGIACDSRHVKPGHLFVAVSGVNQDGSLFVDDAVARGAAAVVCEQGAKVRGDVAVVRVKNCRDAVALLACAFHGDPSGRLQMVGVTGTNGKTTTAYMIRDILRAEGRNPGLIGTVEYALGGRAIPASRTTPDAPTLQSLLAQMVSAGCGSAVMEVSSHSLDQKRTEGIDFDVGVFTNVTRDHLDYHHTVEKYFDAKALLFHGLGQGKKHATAVVNVDDPWGLKLAAMTTLKADILTYGLSREAMVRAEDVAITPAGSSFLARTTWGTQKIHIRLMGRFNVSNALAAIAACGALDVDLETIGGALADMTAVRGRLEEVNTGRGFQVFVDYAHTDDALQNVLQTLREVTRGRLICVFGCGGNRDRTKRPAMGKVVSQLADVAFITSDNPRKEHPLAIIDEIKAGFPSGSVYEVVEDRAAAIQRAIEVAGKGDIVLIAGKGHESFQEFANTSVPFDDRQVVERCLACHP